MEPEDTGVQTVTTLNQVEASAAQAPQGGETGAYEAIRTEAQSDNGEAQPRTFPVRDKEFRVVDVLPGIVLLDLGLAADPRASDIEQLRAVHAFLDSAIHPDDAAAFDHYLRTAQPTIEMEELNKVVEGLIGIVAGGRPTQPS
jgi:hypothetical protein